MIILASLALIAILASLALGRVLVRAMRLPAAADAGDQFFIATWLGLLGIAGALMALAEIVPLNRHVLAAVAIAALIALVAERRFVVAALRALSPAGTAWSALAALALTALGIAVVTSRDLVHFDTGYYQLPEVIWLQEHGLVTGLGLLHHRFGYNSIWLALVAPIQELSHDGRLVAIGSTIACTLLAFQAVCAAGRIAAARGRAADWFMIAAPLSGAFSTWLLSALISSSPDIPTWTLTIVFGWMLLADRDRTLAPAAMMLALGAVAIKLSAMPLVLGALIYGVATRQVTWRSVLAVGLYGALTLGAVMAANVVTSGCLMFPAAITCLPVSWAIPKATAVAVGQFIAHWPLTGNIHEFNAQDIAAYADGTLPILPLGARLRLIFGLAHPLAWALLATIIGFAALGVRAQRDRAGVILFLIGLIGLAFCISVPAYRFAAGWVGLFLGLAMIGIAARARHFTFVRRWRFVRAPLGALGQRIGHHLAHSGIVAASLAVVLVGAALASVDRAGDRDLRESGFAGRPTRLAARWLLPPTLVAHQPSPEKGTISRSDQPLSEPTKFVEIHAGDSTFLRPARGEQCWGVREACVPPGEPFRPIVMRDGAHGLAVALAPDARRLAGAQDMNRDMTADTGASH
jgi:hypothetical protein